MYSRGPHLKDLHLRQKERDVINGINFHAVTCRGLLDQSPKTTSQAQCCGNFSCFSANRVKGVMHYFKDYLDFLANVF